MSYFINMNTASPKATMALLELDKSFVGSKDYLGLAYFWAHEFKHYLRDATISQRKRIHHAWLDNSLSFEAGIDPGIDTSEHWKIISKVLKTEVKR